MDFKPFHDYNRMVRRNAAEPLTCSRCGEPYTLRIEAFTDEPLLQCFICGTMVKPGLRVYQEVLEATDKYFQRDD